MSTINTYTAAGSVQHVPLPKFIEKKGFFHEQVFRWQDIAIYKRWRDPDKVAEPPANPPHFEVIRVRAHTGIKWPNGKWSEPAEFYPSDAEWGIYGWTYPTLERAHKKLAVLRAEQERIEAEQAQEQQRIAAAKLAAIPTRVRIRTK